MRSHEAVEYASSGIPQRSRVADKSHSGGKAWHTGGTDASALSTYLWCSTRLTAKQTRKRCLRSATSIGTWIQTAGLPEDCTSSRTLPRSEGQARRPKTGGPVPLTLAVRPGKEYQSLVEVRMAFILLEAAEGRGQGLVNGGTSVASQTPRERHLIHPHARHSSCSFTTVRGILSQIILSQGTSSAKSLLVACRQLSFRIHFLKVKGSVLDSGVLKSWGLCNGEPRSDYDHNQISPPSRFQTITAA